MPRPLNLLHHHFTETTPDTLLLDLCGAAAPGAPYTAHRDVDLTVIINGFARPEYLPLVWEAVQYQTRRPVETWIIQNDPGLTAPIPRWFFDGLRAGGHTDTRIIAADLNLGCWFRFILAALHCRTRYVVIYDDDTISGQTALASMLGELERTPGVYGGRGIIYNHDPGGPQFWHHQVEGWSADTPTTTRVDFAGHVWCMETLWLRELLRHLPARLLNSPRPGREIGEDMYLSFVAQRQGLHTYVTPHVLPVNASWTSLAGADLGTHPNAISNSPALDGGQAWLDDFVADGWRLLNFDARA